MSVYYRGALIIVQNLHEIKQGGLLCLPLAVPDLLHLPHTYMHAIKYHKHICDKAVLASVKRPKQRVDGINQIIQSNCQCPLTCSCVDPRVAPNKTGMYCFS